MLNSTAVFQGEKLLQGWMAVTLNRGRRRCLVCPAAPSSGAPCPVSSPWFPPGAPQPHIPDSLAEVNSAGVARGPRCTTSPFLEIAGPQSREDAQVTASPDTQGLGQPHFQRCRKLSATTRSRDSNRGESDGSGARVG